MKKTSYIIILVLVAIILMIDIFLLVCGSFEAYPTAEQIEKGRIVYGVFLVPLIIIEVFITTRIFKKK